MPRPPKKAKPAKPDFVFPPGGAAIAPVPGLRLKPRTGDVPRWWPNDKPGKVGLRANNVEGIVWVKRRSKWQVQHLSAARGKHTHVGVFATFEDACAARAAAVDGKATRGDLVVLDGQLRVTHCLKDTCLRKNIPATEFAPDVFRKKKKFSEYAGAINMLLSGLTDATRAAIDERRTSKCMRCRNLLHKSTFDGEYNLIAECRRVIQEIRAHWAANGGCKVCGCCDPEVFSGDHKDREGKEDRKQSLDPVWWAYEGGGPDALRAHYLGPNTTVQCLCLFCHCLASSHNVHVGVDPKDLEDGSQEKRTREYRIANRAHVNADKLRRGKCEHPKCCDPRTGLARVVTLETCHGFHHAHKDEVEKEFQISKMACVRASPATIIPKLDKEMPKCNLYCANCHHKYDTLPRLKEGQELLDALLARGAPVCVECE
jgi:hypothetical protein